MNDGEIQEIRKIRHQISEACGHDPQRVVAYYRAVEQELKESGRFRFEERSKIGPFCDQNDEAKAESAK